MPQADIEINGTAASDENLPIDTLVQLSNNDAGDETTYLWEIVDQPEGTADSLSSTSIENPTITPEKEGTYLLQLTVDQGLGSEVVDRKLFRVRQLKTNNTLQAAEETTEADSSRGWSTAEINTIKDHDNKLVTGIIIAGVAGAAGIVQGDVVQVTGVTTIKSGLPGEEDLPTFEVVLATNTEVIHEPLGVVISTPDGSTTPASGDIILVRYLGLFETVFTGTPTAGDPVYVNDTGDVSLSVGTNHRRIGHAINPSGGNYNLFINGLDSDEDI